MDPNTYQLKIERAYGHPGEIGWSYEAKDEVTGRVILEGEAERKDGIFHLLLRPNEGGRIELEDVADPHEADSRLQVRLKLEAAKLISGKTE